MNSVFFWSEEHAKEQRAQAGGMRGTYLTLSQAAYVTRHAQAALFAFPREAPGT